MYNCEFPFKLSSEGFKNCTSLNNVAYFCYQYFYDPISGVSVKETQTERDAFVPLLKTISWTGNSKQ